MSVSVRRYSFVCAVLLGSLLEARAAGATSLFSQFRGVRAAAMGNAHRGEGGSNDSLWFNPAGMGLSPTYNLDASYIASPFDGLTRLNATAVDGKSGALSAGLGYTRIQGDSSRSDATMNLIAFGSAYPLSDRFRFGITAKYLTGNFTDNGNRRTVSEVTMDAGVMVLLESVRLGFVYENIRRTDTPRFFPPALAFGGSLVRERWSINFDARINQLRNDSWTTFHGGMEYRIVTESFVIPLRIGGERAETIGLFRSDRLEKVLSGGFGLEGEKGAILASYRRSLKRANNWQALFLLRFALQ